MQSFIYSKKRKGLIFHSRYSIRFYTKRILRYKLNSSVHNNNSYLVALTNIQFDKIFTILADIDH